MIILFKGLCQEAGLIGGGPPETRKRTRTGPIGRSAQSNGHRKAQAQPKFEAHTEVEGPGAGSQSAAPDISPDNSLLLGLLKKLPIKEGEWTQAQRNKWLQAFTSTVDLLIEVTDPELEADYS